jgi:hypothetical protein
MEDYNRSFATTPRSDLDFHTPLASSDKLDLTLCRKATRTLSKNLTFQYHKKIFQIHVQRPTYAMRNAEVTVFENSKGEVTILYKNKPIPFEVYYQQEKQAEVVPSKSIDYEQRESKKSRKPAPDHPGTKASLLPHPKRMPPTMGTFLLCQTRLHFNFGLTRHIDGLSSGDHHQDTARQFKGGMKRVERLEVMRFRPAESAPKVHTFSKSKS